MLPIQVGYHLEEKKVLIADQSEETGKTQMSSSIILWAAGWSAIPSFQTTCGTSTLDNFASAIRLKLNLLAQK